jgi:triosephosphate isomerase-like protein
MSRRFFVGGNFKMYVQLTLIPDRLNPSPTQPCPNSSSGCPSKRLSLFYDRNLVVNSVTSIVTNLNTAQLDPSTEVVIAPPSLYLLLVRQLADSKIGVAAQNVFDKPNGAFTGELSVEQLRDAHIDWTIIGHSERRVVLKEDDDVGVSSLVFSCRGLLLI